MARNDSGEHAAGKALRYLRERGMKEFAAHAVEKVRDERFDYNRWVLQQQISSVQAGYQKKLRFRRMPGIRVLVTERPGTAPGMQKEALRRRTVQCVQASTYPGVSVIQGLHSRIGDEDFLAFVREGDLIERNAFFEMVQALQDGGDVVYTDEDSFEDRGGSPRYRDPLFKPDYNPDYLRSCNYIGSLLMVRVGLIRSFYTEGREGLVPSAESLSDPACRYALVLRCTRKASVEGGIRHVPKVLYHALAEENAAAVPVLPRLTDADVAAPGLSRLTDEETAVEQDIFDAEALVSEKRPASSPSPAPEEGHAGPGRRQHVPRTRARKWGRSRRVRKGGTSALSGRGASAEHPARGQHGMRFTMRMALEEDLFERGYRGCVEDGPLPDTFHVSYEIKGEPLVSIVIPNRDCASVLENCIQSIRRRSTWRNYEIIVVENNSRQKQTLELYRRLEENKEARIVRYPHAFHFSRVIHEGVKKAAGDYLVLMNNDVTVQTGDWIERLLAHVSRPETGAAGPKLLYPDGRVQSAGIVTGLMGFAGSMMVAEDGEDPGYMGRAVLTQDVSAVTAACMMVRRSAYEEAGGFPDEFSVALGDVDFCLSLGDAGYRVVFEPSAVMIHHESLTRGAEDTSEKKRRFASEKARFRKKRARVLRDGDPAYNPNLSRRRCDWSQQT